MKHHIICPWLCAVALGLACAGNATAAEAATADAAKEEKKPRVMTRPPARITRGPYLQVATPSSIIVRWRTDNVTSTHVRYGTDPENLKQRATASWFTTEHIVMLKDLKPGTEYHYAVGTTNVALDTNIVHSSTKAVQWTNAQPVGRFTTPPLPGTPAPTRVWVVGDPGTGRRAQREVRDAYYKWTGDRHTDLWILLGDNAYTTGTDTQYQVGIFDAYGEMLRKSCIWPSLGNHDGGSASSPTQAGVYYDIFTLPTMAQAGGVMSGTEAYYSYDHANIHFIVLDSYDSDRMPGSTNGIDRNGPMARWLKADLAANKQEWTVAYWHHPPYTKGTHDSDSRSDSGGRMGDMRDVFLPILEAGGVDVVFTGHSHNYERSWLINGHYGKSTTFDKATMVKNAGNGREDGDGAYRKPTRGPAPSEGVVYVVAGSSGQVASTKPAKTNAPAQIVKKSDLDKESESAEIVDDPADREKQELEARAKEEAENKKLTVLPPKALKLPHPVSYLHTNSLGSAVMDVKGNRLDVTFINEKGERLDYFTILKGEK